MKMDRYRLIIGFIVLLGLVALAVAVALGHVEEKSSFGLTAILAILAKVALDFSEWAFRSSKGTEDKKEDVK
jgi:hypothetical protein